MRFPEHANKNDVAVVSFLLKLAIVKYGWIVSVYDGEEWVVKQSSDEDIISAAMMSTDSDTLRFRGLASKDKVGTVLLVYGNDGECLADASVDGGVFDTFFNEVMDKADEIFTNNR